MPAQPPWPHSSTSGGLSPPSSTAVDTPARTIRRSVTGTPASSRRWASSPATCGLPSRAVRCLLMVDPPFERALVVGLAVIVGDETASD